jgi:cellulose synthase/poly-beta-1,6-N-acetylglucosamine synthase-like glycosyltransferase
LASLSGAGRDPGSRKPVAFCSKRSFQNARRLSEMINQTETKRAQRPKVAICFPSADMVHADFALSLAGLCNAAAPIETPVVNNKSSIVAIARNNGVQRAQELGADFVLFLDSDMVFPRTTLHRLLLSGKDIVGATYPKRVPPYAMLGAAAHMPPRYEAPGLVEMRHMPTGCLLIGMKVFEALSRPYFRFGFDELTGAIAGEDYVFCDRAREAGFSVWCDAHLSQEIGHIGQQVFRIRTETEAA